MRTGYPPRWPTVSRRSVSLVRGTLTILGLVGCTQPPTSTPTSVPVEAAAATSTSVPESETMTNSSPSSQGSSITQPTPAMNSSPTISASVPTLTVRPDSQPKTPVRAATRIMPDAEIIPTLAGPTEANPAEPRLKAFPLPTGSRPRRRSLVHRARFRRTGLAGPRNRPDQTYSVGIGITFPRRHSGA